MRPLVGGLIGLGAAICMRSVWLAEWSSKEPVLWLADRDGGALIGLDRERIPVVRQDFQRPLKVRSSGGQVIWVYGEGVDRKPWLASLDCHGALRTEQTIEPLLDWCSLEAGAILALLKSACGANLVVRVEPGGQRTELDRVYGAQRIAAAGRHWVVACNTGRLQFRTMDEGANAIESSGTELATAAAAGQIGAQHPTCWEGAETEGKRWIALAFDEREVLWALGQRELMRFDTSGRVLGKRTLAGSVLPQVASSNALAASDSGAWVLTAARQALHFDSHLRITQSTERFALGGGSALILGAQGAPRVTLPGALLAFDDQGRELAGQGGFRHLVDLAYCDGGALRGP